jgi:dTDP-4-amino-4,6-dideoxygalactose transaminase
MAITELHIPLVDLKAQYSAIRGEIDAAIARVLQNTSFILGPEVKAFEAAFAAFSGARHAIGISSGTDALHLALRACGVQPGDEVITTPFTFIATAEAITMCGARPVFSDIDPRTGNLDPAALDASITSRTRAIVPVHLYGQPCDIDPILTVAAKRGLRVVEDAAQAHGARYKGRPAGTLADAACFSFYPGKNLGAFGDAGAVTTNSAEIAERIRMLRDHGRRDKYEHLIEGFGNRLDALQAAVLGAKLPHLASWNARRAELAAAYTRALADADLVTPHVPEWADPVWHLYVIQVRDREAARAALARHGIATGVHYPIPLHLQPAYTHLGYRHGAFPAAEHAAASVLSLPLYPEMPADAVDAVARVLAAV